LVGVQPHDPVSSWPLVLLWSAGRCTTPSDCWRLSLSTVSHMLPCHLATCSRTAATTGGLQLLFPTTSTTLSTHLPVPSLHSGRFPSDGPVGTWKTPQLSPRISVVPSGQDCHCSIYYITHPVFWGDGEMYYLRCNFVILNELLSPVST
jgi:hypothetical protein